MRPARVATAFLESGGRVLLLRRSQAVRSMRGLWGGASGAVEAGETPAGCAARELREEAGVSGARLAASAAPVGVYSGRHGGCWEVHPFLFRARDPRVRLNWESSEYAWARPADVRRYDCVPGLAGSLSCLL